MSSAAQRLRHVLAGQQFPAERWQLIVGAELYGADAQSRTSCRRSRRGAIPASPRC